MRKVFTLICLMFFTLAVDALAVSPPAQQESGPGSNTYAHASVTKHKYGEGPMRCWIYEPADPVPQSAPLIIFNHGWGAINPKAYGAWIEHIVRRGNIVIYPVYQDDLHTPVADFLPNALGAVKNALRILQQDRHVHPDLNRCAITGHSMGGLISADMAAVAEEYGIPKPKAVMCVEPGKTWAKIDRVAYRLHDLSSIPSNTLLLAVSGDLDNIVKDIDAKRIYNESTQVPQENKNLIIIMSDDHGIPPLKANHMAPAAQNKEFDSGESIKTESESTDDRRLIRGRIKDRLKERVKERKAGDSDLLEAPAYAEEDASNIDALDYYGYWKLFDALCDAAFYGNNRNYALGNTPEQRFMGVWSDGVLVRELEVQ